MEETLEEILDELRRIRAAMEIYANSRKKEPARSFMIQRGHVRTPSTSEGGQPEPTFRETSGPFLVRDGLYISGLILCPPANKFRASLEAVREIDPEVCFNLSQADFLKEWNENFRGRPYYSFTLSSPLDPLEVKNVLKCYKRVKKKRVLLVSSFPTGSSASIAASILVAEGKTPDEVSDRITEVLPGADRKEIMNIAEWSAEQLVEVKELPEPPAKRKRGRPRKNI